jgi:hypothetical protein
VDALFERLDWLYAGLAVLVVLIPLARFRALGAAGLSLVLLAAASDRVGGPSSGTTFATVNEMLTILGSVVVVVAAVIAMTGGRRASEASSSPVVPQSQVPNPQPLLLIGLALAAAAPHLLLVELGIVLVLVAAARVALASQRFRWLALLVIGGGALGAALVLAVTILGPTGGRMSGLRDGPFSPAAERLLVLLLGAGTLLLAGLPPVHRAPWGIGLAPLAAIMMGRVALPAFPGGVIEWQPLAMLLLAGAGVGAALTRRWPALAVAAGLTSLWSGVPSGVLAAQLLVIWGWLLAISAGLRLGRLPNAADRWTRLALLVPALAALPALEAGLGAQVVLSVAFVAGTVIAFVGEFLRPGSGHAPLY